MTLHLDEAAELSRKESKISEQEAEMTDNYITAKERLENCLGFGNQEMCKYVAEGLPETCLSCKNYKNESTLREEVSEIVILADIISLSCAD